jgi:hypothetical protein
VGVLPCVSAFCELLVVGALSGFIMGFKLFELLVLGKSLSLSQNPLKLSLKKYISKPPIIHKIKSIAKNFFIIQIPLYDVGSVTSPN